MSRVILPFKIYCMINADCRAYMRVAVIEALPYGAEWLTTHLNTMLKGDGEFLWGTDELPHFSWQFSEIVDTAFVDYALIDHEHIVDVTKNILNNGNYPIILMSCDIIFNGNEPDERDEYSNIHDYIIYGYDDDRKAFYMAHSSYEGTFEHLISYDSFKRSYKYIKERMARRSDEKFEMSMLQYRVITVLKTREYSISDLEYVHDAMRTILYYRKSTRHAVSVYDEYGNISETYTQHTGLGVLIGIGAFLDKYTENHEMCRAISRLRHTAKGILEAHMMTEKLLELVGRRLDLSKTEYGQMQEEYNDLVRTVKQCHLLTLKFEHTSEDRILMKIKNKYSDVYVKEQALLGRIYDLLYDKAVNGL